MKFQLCLLVVALLGFLRGGCASPDDLEVLFNQVFKEEGTVAPPEMPALLQRLHTALSERGESPERLLLVGALIGASEISGVQCKRNSDMELQLLRLRSTTEANSNGPQVNRSNSNAVAYLNQCQKDRVDFCDALLEASVEAAASYLAPYKTNLVTLRDSAFDVQPDIVKGIIDTYGDGKKINSARLAEIKATVMSVCNEVNDELKGVFQVHQTFLKGANEFTRKWMDIGKICHAISKDAKGIFEQVKKHSRK